MNEPELAEIKIFYSAEDEGYIATVPGESGLSAFGKTRADALREIELILPDWFEIKREDS